MHKNQAYLHDIGLGQGFSYKVKVQALENFFAEAVVQSPNEVEKSFDECWDYVTDSDPYRLGINSPPYKVNLAGDGKPFLDYSNSLPSPSPDPSTSQKSSTSRRTGPPCILYSSTQNNENENDGERVPEPSQPQPPPPNPLPPTLFLYHSI